ncbi:unnamed protein product, partial [marine sediment metagenome]
MTYTLTLQAGEEGIVGATGYPLQEPLSVDFTTTAFRTAMHVAGAVPVDEAKGVGLRGPIQAYFSCLLDAGSIDQASMKV